MHKPHAVILGLDGMPLHAFNSLFEQGLMPYTKHLWQKLWSSKLRIILPFTLPSWTTISTGVNPGKHGIFDFLRPMPNRSPRLVTKDDLTYPTLPEMLAYNHLPSITINVPVTYPPFTRREDCIVISDWLSPRIRVWPPKEKDIIKRIAVAEGPPRKPLTTEEYLEKIAYRIEKRLELIEYYYTRRKWRLFYAIIPEPDWVFHYTYLETIIARKTNKYVAKTFKTIDKIIRIVSENMPEEALLVMCSDHGFSVAYVAINGNVLLKKAGLLKTMETQANIKSLLFLQLTKMIPPVIKHRLKYRAHIILRNIAHIHEMEFKSLPIDYKNSKAFMTVSYNLYLNPGLPQEQREEVLNMVYELFNSVREYFKVIARKEDIFHGPNIGDAPDLVLIPRESVNISTRLISNRIVEKGKWYIHSNMGFIALNMKSHINIPRDVDIVPTVLSYLKLPLPIDTDGKPLIPEGKGVKRVNYRAYFTLSRRIRRLSLTR